MNYTEILRAVALEYHTTPEAVEREMQAAIDAAYTNPDERARQMQQQIPCKGERPTPEEFILAVAKMLEQPLRF